MMQILLNAIVSGSEYALVAIGFALVYQATRFFDFAFAGVLAIGGYGTVFATQSLGLGPFYAVCFGVLSSVIAGALYQVFVYRYMRRSGASSATMLLASLGLMIASVNTIALMYGDRPRVLPFVSSSDSISIGSGLISPLRLSILAVSLVTAGASCVWFHKTRWGALTRAVSEDSELAGIMGVPIENVIFKTALFGSAIAGLVAALVVLDTGATPTMGFSLLLPGVVAAIVGGIWRLEGAFLGGVLVGIVEQYSGWFLGTAWQEPVLFAVLIIFFIVRPQGIIGVQSKKGYV